MASGRPVVYLTRKETFCASHRLHSQKLSDPENAQLYGKCNNANGHGHNYTVEVTVRAAVHPVTGMAMNISDLKVYIQNVIEQLDHRCLDKDVPYFQMMTSTTENVAIYIWEELSKLLPDMSILYEVTVHETEKNIVTYRGEQQDET